VEVQVVLSQVGEGRRREANAVGSVERQGVGRDLHRARLVTRVEHLPERPLEVDRLRRRSLDLGFGAAHDLLDGPKLARPLPGALEHMAEQEGRGGLAVRAGDPGHPKLRGGIAVEGGGCGRHRTPRVADEGLRDLEVQPALGHQRGGPSLDGGGGEVVPVGAGPGDAEEQRPGLDVARGVGEPGHLGVGLVGPLGDRSAGEDLAELHRGDCR
jgi:hypothetical protein